MSNNNKFHYWRLGIFFGILCAATYVGYLVNVDMQTLPFYNPADLDPKVVDESVQGVTKFHKIGDFSLTSQSGKTVTEKDFEGKIYVADFFFATCQSICPKMSTQMQRLSTEFAEDDVVKFISHSVTPEVDSVEVLRDYADRYGADENKWVLTTGDKKHIYDLARKHYFAVTDEGDGGKHDFIHTENFVLIDKEKRIRGFYDGTDPEQVDLLIDHIGVLHNLYSKGVTH